LPPAPAPSDGAGDTASLLQEVAFLDRAREALLAGDPGRALAALDAYERARVGTRLAAEATLLRIESLLANGERARAAGLAEEFLRAHPETPVADRMRAIIHAASH
jgi:outer membrane protein assembly factor BamD (BamD/ComL family)